MDCRPGDIVWALVSDPNGANAKSRPLVVVGLPETGKVAAVAVTGRVDLFDDVCCVRLPWQHGGHPRTKLTKPCLARCDWLVILETTQVTRSSGRVPEHVLQAIVARLPKPA